MKKMFIPDSLVYIASIYKDNLPFKNIPFPLSLSFQRENRMEDGIMYREYGNLFIPFLPQLSPIDAIFDHVGKKIYLRSVYGKYKYIAYDDNPLTWNATNQFFSAFIADLIEFTLLESKQTHETKMRLFPMGSSTKIIFQQEDLDIVRAIAKIISPETVAHGDIIGMTALIDTEMYSTRKIREYFSLKKKDVKKLLKRQNKAITYAEKDVVYIVVPEGEFDKAAKTIEERLEADMRNGDSITIDSTTLEYIPKEQVYLFIIQNPNIEKGDIEFEKELYARIILP